MIVAATATALSPCSSSPDRSIGVRVVLLTAVLEQVVRELKSGQNTEQGSSSRNNNQIRFYCKVILIS